MSHRIRKHPVPFALVGGIYVMLLSGRTETPGLPGIDLRFILCGLLILFFLLWKGASVSIRRHEKWGPTPYAVILFLGLHSLSALWADPQARSGLVIANAVVVGLALVMLTELSQYGAERVRTFILLSMVWGGTFFALASAVSGERSGVGRAVAFGGGPNVFVRIMIWGAIAAIALLITRKRWIYGALVPFILLFAVLTGSRGGLTAALITAGLTVVVLFRRLRARYAVIFLVAFSLIGWLIWSNQQVRFLIDRRFNWDTIVDSGYGYRDTLWSAALQIFERSPVFGSGMDSFYALASEKTGFPYPHNILLEIAGDLGVVGLLGVAGIVGSIVASFIVSRGRMSTTQWAMVAAASFTFLASMFSGDIFDARFMWIFAALAFPSAAARSESLSPEWSSSPKYEVK